MFYESNFNHPVKSWKLLSIREKPKDIFLNSSFEGSLEFFLPLLHNNPRSTILKRIGRKKL